MKMPEQGMIWRGLYLEKTGKKKRKRERMKEERKEKRRKE